jgi:hypothetical protein
MEIKKIMIIIGEVIFSRKAEMDKSNAPIRFMWMPGVRPVIVPARMPREIVRMISKIILITFIKCEVLNVLWKRGWVCF